MKELLHRRAAVFEEARAMILKAESEKRALTSEEQTQYDARMADVTALGQTIERSRQSADLQAEFDRSLGPRGGDEPGSIHGRGQGSDLADNALNTFLRSGRDAMTAEQRGLFGTADAGVKDGLMIRSASPLSAVTGAAGAYTIPNGFVAQLEQNLKWFGGMRQSRATVVRTATGNPLPWPTVDDTSNTGEQVAENTAITQATTEMSFGVVNFGAYKFSSKLVLVPIELMQDSAFDVQGLVARLLGQRLGRIQNNKFTVGAGSGSSTINGMVTAASSANTSASPTAIVYDELVDLEHSVDPAYRIGAEWMFNDTTAALLEKLKDNNGRPLLNESFAAIAANIKAGDANAPVRYTIKGYPVVLNSDMAAPTAGLKPVAFGDMSKYVIRDVMDVMLVRFGEKYMDSGQIGFVAFMRTDGNLVDAGAHPVKYLTMHA